MNIYTYTYYGFILGYGDFDQEWFDVKANTLDEANEIVSKMRLFAKGQPPLFCAYNGVGIKHLPEGIQII